MKQIFNFLIATLMLIATISSAWAFTMPYPVYGSITSDGSAVQNAEIIVFNENSKVESRARTNSEGFYQIDLANADPSYRIGDSLRISLSYCSNLIECVKSVKIADTGGVKIAWDIVTLSTPIPDDVEILSYICWNGQKVSDASQCPPQVIVTPEIKYVCIDGTEVAKLEDCPEQSNSWWLWVVGILATLLAGVGGWKFYNGKVKHYHRGITGYHDPNTQHSNSKYKHASWKSNPIKCMLDVRKIEKGIDLSQ